MRFPGTADDRFIQWPVAAWFLVAFADEDPKQDAVLGHFHRADSCGGTGRYGGDHASRGRRLRGLPRARAVEHHERPLEGGDPFAKDQLELPEPLLATGRF